MCELAVQGHGCIFTAVYIFFHYMSARSAFCLKTRDGVWTERPDLNSLNFLGDGWESEFWSHSESAPYLWNETKWKAELKRNQILVVVRLNCRSGWVLVQLCWWTWQESTFINLRLHSRKPLFHGHWTMETLQTNLVTLTEVYGIVWLAKCLPSIGKFRLPNLTARLSVGGLLGMSGYA